MNGHSLKSFIKSLKYGDRTDPNNYRPISILPILSTILERAMHSQLLDHLLTNCQKNKSTEFALTLLLDDIRKSVDFGELVGAVFIDLSSVLRRRNQCYAAYRKGQY